LVCLGRKKVEEKRRRPFDASVVRSLLSQSRTREGEQVMSEKGEKHVRVARLGLVRRKQASENKRKRRCSPKNEGRSGKLYPLAIKLPNLPTTTAATTTITHLQVPLPSLAPPPPPPPVPAPVPPSAPAPATGARATAFKPRRAVGGCEGGVVRSVEELVAVVEGAMGKRVEVEEEAEDRREEGEGEGESEREEG